MSFLSILLVSSAFYFAHARPDSQSWSEAFGGDQAHFDDEDGEHAPAVPEESSVSITDPQEYQHKLVDFMKEVSKAVDKHMTPLMSKLDVTKQDELKSMGMNGFASYVNYLLLLIEEKENEKDKGDDQTDEDFPLRDGIILQFGSYHHLATPFIPASQDEDDAYAE